MHDIKLRQKQAHEHWITKAGEEGNTKYHTIHNMTKIYVAQETKKEAGNLVAGKLLEKKKNSSSWMASSSHWYQQTHKL